MEESRFRLRDSENGGCLPLPPPLLTRNGTRYGVSVSVQLIARSTLFAREPNASALSRPNVRH